MPSSFTRPDDPKAPEAWPVATLSRRDPSWPPTTGCDSSCTCGCQAETETYVPVSALLSDEVVETFRRTERIEFGQASAKDGLRRCLQAVVEQVGGKDRG